ncbi:MAG: tRNA epoxyqueuosine(34) reductase QueG [Phycisphaera sp.]|nr:tRNA epoxyqueuosine(34) reductase QueG [Phycisphaera sp.]
MNDATHIKHLAAELDFALCGIAEARPTDYADDLRDWLDAGKHGTMTWLADHLDVRVDPAQLLDGARSVITVADYIGAGAADEVDRSKFTIQKSKVPARIARYAQVDDYHKIIKKRLHQLADTLQAAAPEHRFRACVDTAPILEREHAMRAGLGWTGKHTLTIHPKLGSHLLLGEIVTTLPLEPDAPQADHCGTCTRCIDACPTQCITPYSIDASRCVSYLTIEHRDAIDPALFEAIGDLLYGCDICQDVCPHNTKAARGLATTPDAYNQRPGTLDALTVLNWTEDDRRNAFVRSAMKRAKLHQMKRNALIVLGNAIRSGDVEPAAREQIKRIASDVDEHEVVRQTARNVIDWLAGSGGTDKR